MTRHQAIEERVARCYSLAQLEAAILAALAAEDKDVDHVAAGDLAATDYFHTCGSQAVTTNPGENHDEDNR